MVVHANHAREFDDAVDAAMARARTEASTSGLPSGESLSPSTTSTISSPISPGGSRAPSSPMIAMSVETAWQFARMSAGRSAPGLPWYRSSGPVVPTKAGRTKGIGAYLRVLDAGGERVDTGNVKVDGGTITPPAP